MIIQSKTRQSKLIRRPHFHHNKVLQPNKLNQRNQLNQPNQRCLSGIQHPISSNRKTSALTSLSSSDIEIDGLADVCRPAF